MLDWKKSLALAAANLMALPALAEPDLSGIWMLAGLARDGELLLTEKGQDIQAAYDILTDDPSLQCEPASLARVWANPNSSIAFEQTADHVGIVYELFDLRRHVVLGEQEDMPDTPSTKNVNGDAFAKMGTSVGRYFDDRLIIETYNHEPGYVRTSRGVPQSAQTVSIEELWIDGDTLMLRQTYIDDTVYAKPFVANYEFKRIDATEVPIYGCVDADYDWFEQLNQPATEQP